MAATPKYRLEKLNFDGPLDLLLSLIDKNKVDIYDIPIVEITDQYLAYVGGMEETDLDIVSDFIVMAATLLDIKARMLLPEEETKEDEEEDPRKELADRLIQYKRYKYIAAELKGREEDAIRFMYRDSELPEALKSYVPPVDLNELLKGVTYEGLMEVYEKVLKRMKNAINERAEELKTIKRDRISLIKCIEGLRSYAKGHRRFSFTELLNDRRDRSEVVVSFLAVLELMKMGKISVTQEDLSKDMEVEVKNGADLDELDLSGIDESFG